MCIATSAFLQGWGLCNGAIGGAVGIVFREGERPPAAPRLRPCEVPEISRPCLHGRRPESRTYCADRAFTRLPAPLLPAHDTARACLVGYVPKEPGGGRLAAPGAMPSALSPTHPIRRLRNRTMAGYAMRALGRSPPGAVRTVSQGTSHPPFIPSRERILARVDNQITDGRGRGSLRIEGLAAATRAIRPNLLQEYGDLAEWAKISIHHEELTALCGPR